MNININDLTVGQIKEIQAMSAGIGTDRLPFKIGEKYLFRTVTHIDVGLVKEITGDFVTLSDASWIADTGRYHDCLSHGIFKEVEPYPHDVFINASSLIDAVPWKHELPKEQK
jgi:hypothetical protein